MENPGPQLLNEVFDLNKSREIDAAARRAEVPGGEKVPEKVESRVQNYLDQLQILLNNEDPEKSERARRLIRQMLHDKYIVTPGQIVDYRLRTDQRIARQQGRGDIKITPDVRRNAYTALAGEIEETTDKQTESLDAWMDYLLSEVANYPDWFRYWVFRSILELAPLDIDRHIFPTRERKDGIEKYKFQPFPDIDRAALAHVFDDVKKLMGAVVESNFEDLDTLQREVRSLDNRIKDLSTLLHYKRPGHEINPELIKNKKLRRQLTQEDRTDSDITKEIENLQEQRSLHQSKLVALTQLKYLDFASLYAAHIEPSSPINEQLLRQTKGGWAIFRRGTDPLSDKGIIEIEGVKQETQLSLLDSLEFAKRTYSINTRWCTEGESTARYQLKNGDFYVYYSLDENNQPTIPRVAIRMDGDSIREVRGIADNQNLDSYVGDIVQEKLAQFPDGKAYEKKTSDMRRLTTIENRMNAGRNLKKDELIFLYGINGTIEGFGYQRDPRIAELRARRDPREDAPVVFECDRGEIAWNRHEVSTHTKAYIGPLFEGIFEEFSGLEHLYTSFPEGKITRDKVVIGTKDREELLDAMEKQGIKIGPYAQEMIESPDFMPTEGRLSGIRKLLSSETRQTNETADVVRLTPRDLGFTRPPTTTELFAKIGEFGLGLCPAEVGPQYRLQYADQPMDEWLYIGMKPVIASGSPRVFLLIPHDDELRLDYGFAKPDARWHLEDAKFVFRFRKGS